MTTNADKKSTTIWIIITILLALGLVIVIARVSKGNSWPEEGVTTSTNRQVAMSCTTDMATQFHIHPNLKIFINGEQKEIPSQIGIGPGCMHPLHTHDNTGKIHVESPEKRDFTLADFFAVWDKTFTADQILNYKVDDTHKIRETVNGKETKDYENTVLRDLDEIVIYYEQK